MRDTQSVSRRGAEREGDTEAEAGSKLWDVAQSLRQGSNPPTVRS